MAKTALYKNDVQFCDKRIPFKMEKCITRNFQDILHLLSYYPFCLVLNIIVDTKLQPNTNICIVQIKQNIFTSNERTDQRTKLI